MMVAKVYDSVRKIMSLSISIRILIFIYYENVLICKRALFHMQGLPGLVGVVTSFRKHPLNVVSEHLNLGKAKRRGTKES
jgi:hypothetical protein